MTGVSSTSAVVPQEGAAAQARQASSQQRLALAELAVTDRHVRAHEQAHLAAAGPYATSGASYTYTTGPDGQRYAVAGEVSMDVSPDPSDPEKTIQKARTIQSAANAPADPSSQDRAVAAAAAQMEQAAEQQLAQQQRQANAAYGQSDGDAAGTLISLLA